MGYVSGLFYKWGYWSASRPLTAIFMGLTIVILGMTGFINS